MTKQTHNPQQQTQEEQYLQQAQDFFGQSMGRIKGRMQSDNAQLESMMQQVPEESQAQIQEMTDSYSQFEGVMDQAAQDAGVQDVMDQAAQQAKQQSDEASGQGQDPAEDAAQQAQEMAGGDAQQAQDATGQAQEIAHSLGTLPVGLAGGEPANEFTEDEAGVLARGGLTLEPYAGNRDAASRTAARYAAMLPLALTESEVREMLGVGASRVRQRVADGSLYAINVGRERRFPSFQFVGRTLVPGIGEVLKALPDDLHPIEVESWLTSPDSDLTMDGKYGETSEVLSPREWLISGGSVDALLPTARDL